MIYPDWTKREIVFSIVKGQPEFEDMLELCQGIDSHLEAFTEDKTSFTTEFGGYRMNARIHEDEAGIFIRRACELLNTYYDMIEENPTSKDMNGYLTAEKADELEAWLSDMFEIIFDIPQDNAWQFMEDLVLAISNEKEWPSLDNYTDIAQDFMNFHELIQILHEEDKNVEGLK